MHAATNTASHLSLVNCFFISTRTQQRMRKWLGNVYWRQLIAMSEAWRYFIWSIETGKYRGSGTHMITRPERSSGKWKVHCGSWFSPIFRACWGGPVRHSDHTMLWCRPHKHACQKSISLLIQLPEALQYPTKISHTWLRRRNRVPPLMRLTDTKTVSGKKGRELFYQCKKKLLRHICVGGCRKDITSCDLKPVYGWKKVH